MTRPPIEDILAWAEGATEGPWSVCPEYGQPMTGDEYIYFDGPHDPDAIFVAHARTDVPDLCRYALSLESELAALREAAEACVTRPSARIASEMGGEDPWTAALRAALARRTAP